jgi:hypothetical protein
MSNLVSGENNPILTIISQPAGDFPEWEESEVTGFPLPYQVRVHPERFTVNGTSFAGMTENRADSSLKKDKTKVERGV